MTEAGRAEEPVATPGLSVLIRLYRGHCRRLAAALLVYVVKSSPSWAMPIIAASVVDAVASGDPDQARVLWWDALLLLVLLAQNIPMHRLYTRLVSVAIRAVERDLRLRAAEQVQRMTTAVFGRSSSGGMQTKMLRDAEVIEQASRQLLQDVPAVLLTLAVALAVTGVRTPAFLLILLPAAVCAAACARWTQRPLSALQHEHRTSVEETANTLSTLLRMAPLTKAHGSEDVALDGVRDRLGRHHQLGSRLDVSVGWFSASTWVVVQAFASLSLIAAGWAALNHRLGVGVGDVVLLSGYFTTFTGGILSLLNQLPIIQRGRECAASLQELLALDAVERFEGLPASRPVAGRLRFENVSFRYDDKTVLQDLDLTLHPGEMLAVVGRSGAGKSTLLHLVLGLYRPTTGRVLIDEQDLTKLDLRSYRRQLGVVPQEVVLFDASLRDNIVYGMPEVSTARLDDAIARCGVADLARLLPEGLETRLGEGGVRLSGGQRQRIAIARALARDARLLLLDEATSALDGPSAHAVQSDIREWLRGRTCLIVTHRLSTVQQADRILVLEGGRVVGLDTHEQLLTTCPEYVALVGDPEELHRPSTTEVA